MRSDPILVADVGGTHARFAIAEHCLDERFSLSKPLDMDTQQFRSLVHALAGDIALVHGARGGVIIAGGIAQKIASFLIASEFREHFENKYRLSHYVKSIPTHLLIDPYAALGGAASAGSEAWGK